MGLGVGVAAVVSKALGEKNHQQVKRLTTDSLFLSFFIVLISIIIGLLTIDPLFTALGAEEEQLILIRQYMEVWYLGVPFVVIPMVGNNAIRATGNTTIPSTIMLIAVVVNTILDPIFIFGWGPIPAMGLRGAALATLLARCSTFVASLLYLHFQFKMLSFDIPPLKEILHSWKQILYVSIPAALTQLLLPLSMGVLTKTVASYGEHAVAGVGIAHRIEMFALSPIMALGAVIIPFTGQNLGAKKRERIMKGFQFSTRISLLYGGALTLIFLLLSSWLASFFHSDEDVISVVQSYLFIVSLGYGCMSINRLGSSTFSALNLPFHAAGVNGIRLILLFIPAVLLGSHLWELRGAFIGIAFSSLLSGVITSMWCKGTIKQIKM